MIRTRTHACVDQELPVLCDCQLGYHHHPDGTPFVDQADGAEIRTPGNHAYCVGACQYWGTPTEEFDYRLVTGKRVSARRIQTGWEVTDRANHGRTAVTWENDSVGACAMLGALRLASWKNQRKTS